MPQEPSNGQLEQLSRYTTYVVCALCCMLLLSTIAIVLYAVAISLKIWNATDFPPGADAGFIAVTAAIFGVLITGVFVFMTFRIDRGAVIEARATAEREAGKVMERAAQVLQSAKIEARTEASKAIEGTRTEMLNDAKQASEAFAVSITDKLRRNTITVLQDRNPRLGSNIPRVTIEDLQDD